MKNNTKFDKHKKLEITEMHYGPNRPKAANPVKVQDLTFRDGHQSIFATRGRTEDMLAMAEDMDKAGFYSMEIWGGATFDTMHRYLNEDPWERIRTLKKHIVKTPFSMLLRGQNLVGYRNYADDVVRAFVQRACDNGIDIFRVFDALNDFRNFQTALEVIKKNKKHFQGTICYSLTEPRMGGDVYNLDYYLEKAKQLEEIGADSICIKDMAGLIAPYDAYNLVCALKANTKLPIHLHTHFTSGMADLSLLKAIEAGVDIIDTCMSPYAYRTSHPAIEPLVVSLMGTNRDTGFDIEHLANISSELEKIVPKYLHYLNKTKLSIIDTNVLLHQTPGGMLSNLVNQLKQMGELDRLDDVFEELPKVREDLGQVPLVTPTSQIVGIQTVNNVLFDKDKDKTKDKGKENGKYTKITEQVKDLCYGLYGKTPRPINKKIQEKALKDYPRGQKPITERPGKVLENELEKVKEEVKNLAKDMDDTLIYALFPITGKKFLKWKYGIEQAPNEVKPITLEDVKKENELIDKALAGKLVPKQDKEIPDKASDSRSFDVFVDGDYFKVEVNEPGAASLSPHLHSYSIPQAVQQPRIHQSDVPAAQISASNPGAGTSVGTSTSSGKTGTKVAAQIAKGDVPVVAPMPGLIISHEKKVGETVKAGETVIVLEAMKMNNNIEASCDGVVKEILSEIGSSAAKDDILCIIKTS